MNLADFFAIVIGLVGLVGCIVPILPGPPFTWAGLLLIYIWGHDSAAVSPTFLWVWCAIMIVVTVLDYIIPAKFTRATGGTKAAERGALVGTFVGLLFFPPLGILLGAFVGALVGEIATNGKDFPQAIGPAFGAFLGFLLSTFLKIVVCFIMMFYIVKFAV